MTVHEDATSSSGDCGDWRGCTASVSTGCGRWAVSTKRPGVPSAALPLALAVGYVAWPERGDRGAVHVARDTRQGGTEVVVGWWVPCLCSHLPTLPLAMHRALFYVERQSVLRGAHQHVQGQGYYTSRWWNPSDCKLQALLSFTGLRTAFSPNSLHEGRCHLKQKCQKKAGREHSQNNFSKTKFFPSPI